MNRVLVVLAIVAALPVQAGAQEPPSPFETLVAKYRSGSVESAVNETQELSESAVFAREKHRWINRAIRRKEVLQLEAALMLQTETVFVAWNEADQLGTTVPAALLLDLKRLHDAVAAVAPKSPFIRGWYLLLESYYQGQACPYVELVSMYLHRALASFPDDAELLLAAASRYETIWWAAADNPQRHPNGRSGSSAEALQRARSFLRKSVAARPLITEAILRLARVLTLLGDLDDAAAELRRYQALVDGPASRYMSYLFLGDLSERRGDRPGAAAAYASAIAAVPVAQSARIAAAHLAYAGGDRPESAQAAVRAMSEPLTHGDPWWWYVRGRWWRFERDLEGMRARVR